MSENTNKPVFYSSSKKRWTSFKWLFRFFIFFCFISVLIILFAISGKNLVKLPSLMTRAEIYKTVLDPGNPLIFKSKHNQEFRDIQRKLKKNHNLTIKVNNKPVKLPYIRAGFYVNWDVQSFYSLKENLSKMNLIFPEWFFISSSGDSVVANIDQKALKLLKENNVPIIPILSNYSGASWKSSSISSILKDKRKSKKLINSLLKLIEKYQFSGVNIDFEEVNQKSDQELIDFQKQLYYSMKAKGLWVTMDVPPMNSDYNLGELAKYNDFIVLMAYDEHDESTKPGPISGYNWSGTVLDEICKAVPLQKIIYGVAAYGYDWPRGSKAKDITYEEAMVTAQESEGDVSYDKDEYNLSYGYSDELGINHDVYFTDAATDFNLMRLAYDYGIVNMALWRLGSEDPRLWKFYYRDLSYYGLEKGGFSIKDLQSTKIRSSVDFDGEGEVMNLVSLPQAGKLSLEFDNSDKVISGETYDQLPTSYLIKKYGQKDKTVCLTFDDGPDPKYTSQIISILKREKVPAAFFVIGINAENNLDMLRREYLEGYEIGNHTFSHPNIATISPERVHLELNSTRRIIECITGHSTLMFRAPYNADSEPGSFQELFPIELARRENYYAIGESIDPEDWEPGISADSIVARVIRYKDLGSCILLHDSGGNREATVEALPRIIKYFKSHGYKFSSISSMIGKSREYLMPPVSGGNDIYLTRANFYIAETIFYAGKIIFGLFLLGIVLSILRMLAIAILAYMQKKQCKDLPPLDDGPKLSVIVPAYNEEVNAVKTMQSLLGSRYKNLEIVFVDDGSKDSTYSVVEEAFGDNQKVKVYTKPNGGKSSALNYGISRADSDYVVCIDADTILMPDALGYLMAAFSNPDIDAVAGNVKVGNEKGLLTRWQSLEYITSQNFDRRAFDFLNCITVVPGAIGAFKKEAVLRAGGFGTDTLAEDSDLTINILRNGGKISYSEKAIAMTEAPETFKMFFKQRFRWSFGIFQTLWKHRDTWFNNSYGTLGWVAMPNTLIFQFLMPLISPIADVLMVYSVLMGNGLNMLLYYLAFLSVDALGAAVAFSFESENPWRILLLIPQRFVYRQMMYLILFKALLSAIKGEIVGWGSLKRTGSVKAGK